MAKIKIIVGARCSPLARAQVAEVEKELFQYKEAQEIAFDYLWIETKGDKDKITSLREMDKSDFFTKEIDEALMKKHCRIAIHSAKDLPDPLPDGIKVIAITSGVDNRDSLVLNDGIDISSLPSHALIGTSSSRREEAVKQLRRDLSFCDIRGTIQERLQLLYSGKVDGVVIAEAALIRLGLTHATRCLLPGKTVEGQGQLAITALQGDEEMERLFFCLDTRYAR